MTIPTQQAYPQLPPQQQPQYYQAVPQPIHQNQQYKPSPLKTRSDSTLNTLFGNYGSI